MGDLFSYATFLCFFVFLVILSLHLLRLLFKDNSTKSSTTLPPGKSGWPFIGESLEFFSSCRHGYPENFIFDRIKRYSSNVFRTHLFMENFVVFCGAPGNKFLFSNENKLVQGWLPKPVVKILPSLASKEESIRKILIHFFKPESLQSYISIMDSLAQKHFSSDRENKNEVVVFPLIKHYIFRVACRLLVSVEDPIHIAKLEGPFNNIASGMLSLPIDLPGTKFRQALNDSKFIKLELVKIIKQRITDLGDGKATGTQDILSHMLLRSDEDGKFMNEIDIAHRILGLLIAHDTTSPACTFVVKYLAELPEVYDGVYREQMGIAKSKGPGEVLNWDDIQKMQYSWNVACETMRLAPSLPGGFKEAINDFTFNGFLIPKGWKLYWSANATHKNPEYFPDPDKFDPSRFQGSGPAPPYTFVPFGGGPRMCPGKEHARLEILVFMHHLVRRFRWEKVIPDEKIVVNPMPFPAKGLPVRLYPHKALNVE